ncbi:MAG TPA: HDOD domain-containing protein [Tepidisphaeraceae bacterium]|nr:HDOD domain-containing protein [Tepidisphaeraceae bacterium]
MADNPSADTSQKSSLEQQVRTRIQGLSYLPTTAAVAMKFMELGKDPEAEPSDYAKVISSDASLSSKILALSNSSWFGVRNKVTKPQAAVNLLGLGTIRTLAISYCLTGLHNDLKLSSEESRMFWSASLCKAVAARQYAAHFKASLGEEAFACGIFQDIALPVMYALSKEQVLALLKDPAIDAQARLQKERAIFGLDHCEIARITAQKLELPELFIDAVAFHHNAESLREFVAEPIIADACHIASLFPHFLENWNGQDAAAMEKFLAERTQQKPLDCKTFMEKVQKDFNQIYAYFEQGGEGQTHNLADLLANACKEVADNTTRLVGSVTELMGQAAAAGQQVHNLLQQQSKLARAAVTDPLTQALNREGFTTEAREILASSQRYGVGYAMVYLDVDQFKQLNDSAGHVHGDKALQHAARAMFENIRKNDVVGRLGGDEFVVLLNDVTEDVASQVAERILAAAKTPPADRPKSAPTTPTLSAGLLYVPPRAPGLPLESLLSMADGLMYRSKRAGGNRLHKSNLLSGQTAASA